MANNRGFYNGKIGGNPWTVYTELINWDIGVMPHNNRKTLDSFFLEKRKSYRAKRNLKDSGKLNGWRITDTRHKDERGCQSCCPPEEIIDEDTGQVTYEEQQAGCECCKFYYAVNNDRTKYAIIRTYCHSECIPQIISCGDRCPCAEDTFFDVQGRSTPLLTGPDDDGNMYSSAEIRNENTDGRALVNDNLVGGNLAGPKPGDYVQIVGTDIGSKSICGGIREVTNVSERLGDGGWRWKLQFNVPRDGIPPIDVSASDLTEEQLEAIELLEQSNLGYLDSTSSVHLDGAQMIYFSDIDTVPGYVGGGTINTIVGCGPADYLSEEDPNCPDECRSPEELGDVICDGNIDACIRSVENHLGSMVYTTDKGYTFFGNTFDQLQINGANNQRVGSDKIETVSYKGFIINFGKKSVNAITLSEDGGQSFLQELDTGGIGIHNKGALTRMNGGLYFIGSDRRIYGASLSSNGSSYDIDLVDWGQELPILNEFMDTVKDGDEIYMSSGGGIIYVFINSRDSDDAMQPNKTRILKFYIDYKMWMVHEICGEVVTSYNCGEFMGENVYNYCGRDGDGEANTPTDDEYGNPHWYGSGYEAIAEAFIYDNNSHGMQSDDGIEMDMFRRHQLKKGSMILGQGLYTESTRMQMLRGNKRERGRRWNMDKDNCWIENCKKARYCQPLEMEECFKSQLSSCDDTGNKCEGGEPTCLPADDRCGCEGEKKRKNSFCVCYDDYSIPLAKVEAFELQFTDQRARYHRVRFVSGYTETVDDEGAITQVNDVASFGGMIIETNSEMGFGHDLEPFTKDCCYGDKVDKGDAS